MKEQATASKYEKIKAFLLEEALKPESRLKMPTVQELMRKFGASQSPVSRAIRDLERDGVVRCRRGSGMVSCSVPVHEESFLKTAEESGKTVLFLRTDYFAESLWNMEHTILSYARQSRISVINYQMGQDADIMAIIETVQASHSLSGIVMNSGPEVKSGEVIRYLSDLPFPVVMINSSNIYEDAGKNVTILSLDSAQAGRLCVEALARTGHKKIGYVRNEPECDLTRMRLTGISEAAEKTGIAVTCFPGTVKSWENSAQAAEKITRLHLDEIRSLGLTAMILQRNGSACRTPGASARGIPHSGRHQRNQRGRRQYHGTALSRRFHCNRRISPAVPRRARHHHRKSAVSRNQIVRLSIYRTRISEKT